jgi:hypothetical protein
VRHACCDAWKACAAGCWASWGCWGITYGAGTGADPVVVGMLTTGLRATEVGTGIGDAYVPEVESAG